MIGILAIDPGKSGGIAWDKRGMVEAVPMPIAGKDIDYAQLAAIIRTVRPSWIVLEKVASRPRQGVAGVFTFGTGYGAVLGIAAALEIPLELPTPQRWKGKILHGTAKDKDAAIAYCRRAFPSVSLIPPRCRTPHDGIADALCLLEYGRRELASMEATA